MFGFNKKKVELPKNAFVAVASGELVPLSSVNDPVFSQKIMGEGVAIKLSEDYVVAPCDGTVTMLYPTMHSFGMANEDGVEILIHIGIDTVKLQGKGFKKFVSQGDKVKAGDKIIRVDSYSLANDGVDLTTMMLFPNCQRVLNIKSSGFAEKGKTIVASYTEKED